MNVDPNGLKPNRMYYALITGIAYLVDEIVTTFKDFTWLVISVYDAVKTYSAVKKASKQSRTEQAQRIIDASPELKKKIEKTVRKKAAKAGLKVLKKSLGGAYLISRFGVGIVQGGRNKYFKKASKFRNAASYAKYIVETRLH